MGILGIGVREKAFLGDQLYWELEDGFEGPVLSVADVDDAPDSGVDVGMGWPFAVRVLWGATGSVVVVVVATVVIVWSVVEVGDRVVALFVTVVFVIFIVFVVFVVFVVVPTFVVVFIARIAVVYKLEYVLVYEVTDI